MKKDKQGTHEFERLVNTLLGNTIKENKINFSPAFFSIQKNWQNIIGTKFYKYCAPDKLYFRKNTKNNATLYVVCYNSVVSFYIESAKNIILDKINVIFGYRMISTLKIRQEARIIKDNLKVIQKIQLTEDEKKNIKQIFSNIDNENIRKILIEIGENMIANTKIN